MNNKNETFDKAFDLLLEEAAKSADEQIGENLSETAENIEFSKEHERKMEQLFRRERSRQNMKKWAKYAGRAACILAAVVIVSGAAMFSVDAWRVKFLNFVLESGQPNTDYNFSDNAGTSYSNGEITLNYVPEGFTMRESNVLPESVSLIFSDDEIYFQVDVNDIDINSSIDTENGTAERTTVNGHGAVYTSNPNINAVIWHDDKYAYRVMGTVEKEEIMKIAENMKN